MASFIPRSLEPYQKSELLEKRICELRKAVESGASAEKATRVAEKVRAAVLAVIKARRSLLASTTAAQTLPPDHPDAEKLTRQMENLRQSEEHWRSLEWSEIARHYTKQE